jgi:hypothetical protein
MPDVLSLPFTLVLVSHVNETWAICHLYLAIAIAIAIAKMLIKEDCNQQCESSYCSFYCSFNILYHHCDCSAVVCQDQNGHRWRSKGKVGVASS